MKCGCGVKEKTDTALKDYEIIFCPLHSQAEAMLEALKEEHRENSPYHSVWYEDCDLCTLIAKAEGGKG